MWNNIKIALKKTLPRSLRKTVSRLRNDIMDRLHGKRDPKEWDRILDDDVYLVSYPRSGNTWLRNIMTNLRFPDARWDLHAMAVAFPEVYSNVDPMSVPQPRWIKSHHTYNTKYPKVIYLIRDARDVAISYYHWSNSSEFQTFEAFLDEVILAPAQEPGGFGAWHKHVTEWLDHQSEHMLILKYEDLLAEPVAEILRICAFVGLERTADEINRALIESTSEKQQKDFSNFKPLKNRKVGVKGGMNLREKYFNDALQEKFWRISGDAMKRAGYEK